MSATISSVYPIAPVPCNQVETLDLEGMKRLLDCVVDQGVDGICVLANYSDCVRHPFEPLSDRTRSGLRELARAVDPFARRWGK